MRCHWYTDRDGQRYHIPYCWAVINSGNPADCYCNEKPNKSFDQIIGERFDKMEKKIIALEKELNDLKSI